MLREKTVFVIGAGASKEFGLPVGSELVDIICEALDFRLHYGQLADRGDEYIFDAIRRLSIKAGHQSNVYMPECRKLTGGIKAFYSIDNYLNSMSTNKHLVEVGKIAICRSILKAEKSSKLYVDTQSGKSFSLERIEKSWLLPLLKMLTSNIKRENINDIFKNFAIICFNYDRCIEHALYEAIKISFSLTDAETKQCMSTLCIAHPYGTVGKLPWQEGPLFVPFGSDERPDLEIIAEGLSLFTEQKEDSEFSDFVDRHVKDARKIVFLGFGYYKQNLDLIERDTDDEVKIIGTSIGLSKSDCDIITKDLKHRFKYTTNFLDPNYVANKPSSGISKFFPRSIHFEDLTCVELLRSYSRFLADI